MDQIQKINNIYDLISSVIKRPALFGVSNVEDLYLLLFGYEMGNIRGHGNESTEFMSDFRLFVNNRFADEFTSKIDYDWARLIRLYSAGDKHSLELFGNLFEQFKSTSQSSHA